MVGEGRVDVGVFADHELSLQSQVEVRVHDRGWWHSPFEETAPIVRDSVQRAHAPSIPTESNEGEMKWC